ncbi:hypothetical protein BD779DRAFT_1607281 [Infundibulicybe gibba]|nr:hypothetical protein BD779DRAFT_1607281 [Infundibulicybe gibba]
MSLPPILYHYFPLPLPYARTLALQERIHTVQLSQRQSASHRDVLLLLQHRPVYTGGRRQSASALQAERERLEKLGAELVLTGRGGELTYHGPGQVVGYPLVDLARWTPTVGIRDYICLLQKTVGGHLLGSHGIKCIASEHTGLFLDEKTKIGSIGVQVRHRLTGHGFAMNVTREPGEWFKQIVACGLEGVSAGCIETAARKAGLSVEGEIGGLVDTFGRVFGREMARMDAIRELEEEAARAGSWASVPL